jgi:hypothetical protein
VRVNASLLDRNVSIKELMSHVLSTDVTDVTSPAQHSAITSLLSATEKAGRHVRIEHRATTLAEPSAAKLETTQQSQRRLDLISNQCNAVDNNSAGLLRLRIVEKRDLLHANFTGAVLQPFSTQVEKLSCFSTSQLPSATYRSFIESRKRKQERNSKATEWVSKPVVPTSRMLRHMLETAAKSVDSGRPPSRARTPVEALAPLRRAAVSQLMQMVAEAPSDSLMGSHDDRFSGTDHRPASRLRITLSDPSA